MEDSNLQNIFTATLERKYGSWSKDSALFGSTSYGVVAKDLSISASQFSKLIYGSATDGMYSRTIGNIKRLIDKSHIDEQLVLAKKKNEVLSIKIKSQNLSLNKRKKLMLMIVLGSVLLGVLCASIYYQIWGNKAYISDELVTHPLSEFFDQDFNANFNAPYLSDSEVQEFCPCSAFEGKWSLFAPYKLPLPTNGNPGVYYLGKSADVRMKCSRYEELDNEKGRVLMGYEYLTNEIWVDTKLTPLSPKYFDKKNLKYTAEFDALDFSSNPQFKKVATIHSFFIDKFEIHNDSIVRSGEPYGRYASDINEELAKKYKIDVKHVLKNVLSDLTTTSCAPTINAYCDPNQLHELESIIAFECTYTIKSENLGMGGGYPYRKGYKLTEQYYSDNLTCTCRDKK